MGFIWEHLLKSSLVCPSASATESAPPLPSPPDAILSHPLTVFTLRECRHLFAIVTPINVSQLELLLASHPNRAFVDSILTGLKDGFWPPADEDLDLHPQSRDFPQHPLSPRSLEFAHSQCTEEEHLGWFSPPFSSSADPLLPGMISILVHTVPKKSGKLRLVVDHSAGDFSPNSHIVRDDVHNDLDTILHLGHNLLHLRHSFGTVPVWLLQMQQLWRKGIHDDLVCLYVTGALDC
jgi:hypothetical protein